MTSKREDRRAAATLDQVRSDPASLYDADYYDAGYATESTEAYGRHEPWLSFFAGVAKQIVRHYKPKTTVDVGCAYGLLVEALCDKGVDAYGFDISPYAISNARDDMKDRLRVHSILEPIPVRVPGDKYDLAICIEVLEHLPPEQADIAIENLCAVSDRILFSSSPNDFEEPTHFNVLPTEEWIAKFAGHGFEVSRGVAPGFIAPHAIALDRIGLKRPGLLRRLLGN